MSSNIEWRPIPEYEGVYEISEFGDVRRVAPGKGTQPGHILTPKRVVAGLARRFGVSQAQISRIVHGKRWAHI
jgi:hypothetical protein